MTNTTQEELDKAEFERNYPTGKIAHDLRYNFLLVWQGAIKYARRTPPAEQQAEGMTDAQSIVARLKAMPVWDSMPSHDFHAALDELFVAVTHLASKRDGEAVLAEVKRRLQKMADGNDNYRQGYLWALEMIAIVEAAHPPANQGAEREPAKSHCQNGGDVCLAGNRDGICCPDESCDIDDGVRKNPEKATGSGEMTTQELADDDALRFIQRVLESSAPESDRKAARNMALEMRMRFRQAIAQCGDRRDAERYRWLRNNANSVEHTAPLVFNAPGDGGPVSWLSALYEKKLDTACDAAIAKEQGK